ncbi:granulin [Dictyocaulus viviparus]|uniref:Granulin n=1 Tax=Dictyocaulus viviparus TaxID=29172 RepID=A0A0D8Y891_DICVI|nr:granulin [Dictyocaulus viviparus]
MACIKLLFFLHSLVFITDGNWGCCPIQNAVCCDDFVHCCPENSKCDEKSQQCINQIGERSPLWKKFVARKNEAICPDKRSKCPPGSTCCLLLSGKYGCCPVEHATCCADHLHCCPSGYKCDATGQRCIERETANVINSFRKHKATPIRKKSALHMVYSSERSVDSDIDLISCGYGKVCPSFSTCCEIVQQGRIHHMCCPLRNGECCKDTCCPFGYYCRPKGTCEKKAVRNVFIEI